MGWKSRDFYLDPDHTPYLFDSNGNARDDRVVGRPDRRLLGPGPGRVVSVVLREDVGADGVAALDAEASA